MCLACTCVPFPNPCCCLPPAPRQPRPSRAPPRVHLPLLRWAPHGGGGGAVGACLPPTHAVSTTASQPTCAATDHGTAARPEAEPPSAVGPPSSPPPHSRPPRFGAGPAGLRMTIPFGGRPRSGVPLGHKAVLLLSLRGPLLRALASTCCVPPCWRGPVWGAGAGAGGAKPLRGFGLHAPLSGDAAGPSAEWVLSPCRARGLQTPCSPSGLSTVLAAPRQRGLPGRAPRILLALAAQAGCRAGDIGPRCGPAACSQLWARPRGPTEPRRQPGHTTSPAAGLGTQASGRASSWALQTPLWGHSISCAGSARPRLLGQNRRWGTAGRPGPGGGRLRPSPACPHLPPARPGPGPPTSPGLGPKAACSEPRWKAGLLPPRWHRAPHASGHRGSGSLCTPRHRSRHAASLRGPHRTRRSPGTRLVRKKSTKQRPPAAAKHRAAQGLTCTDKPARAASQPALAPGPPQPGLVLRAPATQVQPRDRGALRTHAPGERAAGPARRAEGGQ